MIGVLLSAVLLGAPPFVGVAVTPYSEDPSRGLTFGGMIDEIHRLGATHVSIVVQWSQNNVASHHIRPHPKETQDEQVIRAMIRRARGLGLRVMLFPIIWVDERGPGLWRGTLRPENPVAWWASYRTFILHFAAVAQEEHADLFSVGSELGSMEADAARWRRLIAEVRARFGGRLLYSANWDHYEHVPFWDALDAIGLTGYHRLTQVQPPSQPTEAELLDSWSRIRTVLVDWQTNHHPDRPLLFTEIGYPSIDGAAYRPWEYTMGGRVDLEEQRRCWAAFSDTWRNDSHLGGFFAWNWWGVGGREDTNYTPRGKPSEQILRDFSRP